MNEAATFPLRASWRHVANVITEDTQPIAPLDEADGSPRDTR